MKAPLSSLYLCTIVCPLLIAPSLGIFPSENFERSATLLIYHICLKFFICWGGHVLLKQNAIKQFHSGDVFYFLLLCETVLRQLTCFLPLSTHGGGGDLRGRGFEFFLLDPTLKKSSQNP